MKLVLKCQYTQMLVSREILPAFVSFKSPEQGKNFVLFTLDLDETHSIDFKKIHQLLDLAKNWFRDLRLSHLTIKQ